MPTSLPADRRSGYRYTSIAVPSAPAPTDVRVTIAPSSTPHTIVSDGCIALKRALSPSRRRVPSEWIGSLNRMPSAVTTSARPSVNVIRPLRNWPTCEKCIHASVSAAAGRLPMASRRTICQSTVPAWWCTAVPNILVIDA